MFLNSCNIKCMLQFYGRNQILERISENSLIRCRRKLWFNKLNYFSFNADGKTSKSGTLSTSQYQFCLAGSITLLNSSNLFRQIQFSFLVYLSVAVLLEQFANDVMTVPFLSSCETWRISLGFFYLKLYYYRTL